jgi:hypothetical protein
VSLCTRGSCSQLPSLPGLRGTFKMALDGTTPLQLVLLLTWTCLSTCPPPKKHPIFTQLLPSQVNLEQLLSSTSLVFAPGLFEVLQSSTPPTASYFKTLPTKCTKLWAIYLLVLERPGCRPKIYIGSGTNTRRGVSERFTTYNSEGHTSIPHYVARA